MKTDKERINFEKRRKVCQTKMENKLSVSPMPTDLRMGFRRHSSSARTPPRSPIFLIHKPDSTPGDLGSTDSNISGYSLSNDKHLLSPLNRRFSTKKVCTMDCANCRSIAKNLRAESPNQIGFLSAPCSRKSSMALGKSKLNSIS